MNGIGTRELETKKHPEISEGEVRLSEKAETLKELHAREATDRELFIMLVDPENYIKNLGRKIWLRNNSDIRPSEHNGITEKGELEPVSPKRFYELPIEWRVRANSEAQSGRKNLNFIVFIGAAGLELHVADGPNATALLAFVRENKHLHHEDSGFPGVIKRN